MARVTWLLILALGSSLAAGGAQAQGRLRVAQTLGDATEATCVATDGDELWVGTLGAGMFRVRGGGTPERFDSTRGLFGNRVRDCALTGKVLWVATEAGISRFDPDRQR